MLLVDDEEELVSTLVERLAFRGIRADWVRSGLEALQHVKQSDYQAVILDWKLPGMSSLEVMHHINSGYPRIKILIMTGQVDVEEELTNLLNEWPSLTHEILFKPIKIDVLVEKIRNAIRGG